VRANTGEQCCSDLQDGTYRKTEDNDALTLRSSTPSAVEINKKAAIENLGVSWNYMSNLGGTILCFVEFLGIVFWLTRNVL
jgi:hypothetical protein